VSTAQQVLQRSAELDLALFDNRVVIRRTGGAVRQYVDFLGDQPPYDALDPKDLERLARRVEVEYVTAGTEIVPADGPAAGYLYVVRKGMVEVRDRGRVVDQLGAGDTFGHISLMSGLSSPYAVYAGEDSLIYRLPDPRGLLEHPERLHFTHYDRRLAGRASRARLIDLDDESLDHATRPPLWCQPVATIREVAALITHGRQSSALVPTPAGLGIITDSDIRRCVGEGRLPLDAAATHLATVPVLTVSAKTPRARAFALMIEHGVHHLVVIDNEQRPVGVVRVMDLASGDLRDPLLIRAAIEASGSLDELAEAARSLPATATELVKSGVPAVRAGSLLAAVREALLRKLVHLTGNDEYGWILLGSTARREPLPSSDVDTAITWRGAPREGVEEQGRRLRAHQHAEQVLGEMERCGLRRCPDGVNATDPRFSRSLRNWRDAADAWQVSPAGQDPMVLTSMLTDARGIARPDVGLSLGNLLGRAQPSRQLLETMLRWAIALKPPVGFVGNFVVEHSGEHHGQLDLKRAGLMPIASIGQWAAVVTGAQHGSTPERLKRAYDASILTKDEADSLERAFVMIYELLLEREAAALGAGAASNRSLNPGDVDPLTRRHLRSAFREVVRVQDQLERDWTGRLP
jgi:CBS domain-containing protein